MSISRTLTVGACLLSVTGFAGAQAEVFTAAAVVETPDTQITLPASPPAPVPQPAEASEPAPAQTAPQAAAEPAPAAKAVPAIAPVPVRRAASASAVSGSELECLAKVVLYEAGSEPRAGQIAVAQVVMNRVRSPRFPNSICGVIYQRGQFAAIRSYSPPRGARWNRAMALAREVTSGEAAPVVGRALYFHATRVRPAFARTQTRVAQIGGHVFYR